MVEEMHQDSPEGPTNLADWKKYRQKLRDMTKTYNSLVDVKWPKEPSS